MIFSLSTFRILHRVREITECFYTTPPVPRKCRNTRTCAQVKHRQGVRAAWCVWRVCQCALSALFFCALPTQYYKIIYTLLKEKSNPPAAYGRVTRRVRSASGRTVVYYES
jgi:hypothetical protein